MGISLDYNSITDRIKEILDDNLEEVTVTTEEQMNFPAEMTPWVGVYLTRRTPSANQFMRAGHRIDYDLTFNIWCWAYRMQLPEVVRARNALIKDIEQILLANANLRDEVMTSFLEGGEMTTAALTEDPGFVAGGEIVLRVQTAIIRED